MDWMRGENLVKQLHWNCDPPCHLKHVSMEQNLCSSHTTTTWGKRGTYLQKRKRFDTKSDKVCISVHYEYVASATNCDYYRISLVENVPVHISNFHMFPNIHLKPKKSFTHMYLNQYFRMYLQHTII